MTETRALLFDVFGTLVDWRAGILERAVALGSWHGDWEPVVDDWRRAYQPALDRVRAEPQWRDLDAVHRETLADTLDSHGVELGGEDREALVTAWRHLPPWPDTRAGLDRLRTGFRTASLSNGHVALLVDLFRFGDLRFDAVLSAQLAGSYKPDPSTYLRAAELLGCAPVEVAMVAAHGEDLLAAAEVGMRPMFVRRPREWGPGGGDEPPEDLSGLVVADDLQDLADLVIGPR